MVTRIFIFPLNHIFPFPSTFFSFLVFLLYSIFKYNLTGQTKWFFSTKGCCYFNSFETLFSSVQFFPTCPSTLLQHCHYHNCNSITEPMYRQCMLTDLMVLTIKKTKVSLPTHPFLLFAPFTVQMSAFIVCKMTVKPMIMVWCASFGWQCLYNDFSNTLTSQH